MDVAAGTDPPRLARLPAKSRSVMCMVLEGPMISCASFWQGGRRTWQIQHDSNQGRGHLETFGDLPPTFANLREIALEQQRAQDGVDYVFSVPPDTAATITGYKYDGVEEDDFFRNLQSLVPANDVPDPSDPPRWWQWD
jgi:hypothetical protein